VIVTELFARKFFAGRNPIGQVFQIEENPGKARPLNRIIGVVKNSKYTELREEFTPIGFFTASQEEKRDAFLQVVVRSNAPLATITPEVSSAVILSESAAVSLGGATLEPEPEAA
jgi:hypothetical protein